MNKNVKKIIISAGSFSIGVLCGFTICGCKVVKTIHKNYYVRFGMKTAFEKYLYDILYSEQKENIKKED